jgi:MoxR-like ATPase
MSQANFANKISHELKKVIFGQQYLIDRLLIGLLSNGHVLLEGKPGLAKTLTIKSLAKTINVKFSRIQFTPDLLPADITGTMVFNQQTNEFFVRTGPIFANFILADEINRAPAKVQSALLEVMQEKQVTLGNKTYHLKEPFLVLATQNPIEQEGTYPLPEAQLDRFMLKVVIDYPDRETEQQIVSNHINEKEVALVNQVVSGEDVFEARSAVKQVYLDKKIEKYIIDIVFATRYPENCGLKQLKDYIVFGASPRGSINLALAAKAHAFLSGRDNVIPEDVKALSADVLCHRIGLNYRADADRKTARSVIEDILKSIPTP